jgi:hypothetical protein
MNNDPFTRSAPLTYEQQLTQQAEEANAQIERYLARIQHAEQHPDPTLATQYWVKVDELETARNGILNRLAAQEAAQLRRQS